MADVTLRVNPEKKKEARPDAIQVSLKMRKTLDGNLMIFDHPEIDIVILPKKKKVVTFPKENAKDDVYNIQNRFFDFLIKKGVALPETVQGGSVFGSIEADYPSNEEVDEVQVLVWVISKFVSKDNPQMLSKVKREEMDDERLLEPDEEASTELGEVPHETSKGAISPYQRYGMLYRYFEE